jgi:hypothetical protein
VKPASGDSRYRDGSESEPYLIGGLKSGRRGQGAFIVDQM